MSNHREPRHDHAAGATAGADAGLGDIREQFTRQAYRFATSPHANDAEAMARLLTAAAPRAADRCVDLACGPGLVAAALSPHVAHVTGVDLTDRMVEKARALFSERGLENGAFVVGDATRTGLPTGSFDLAVSRLALHHIADPAAALAEMARLLSPGGRAAIMDMTTSEDAEKAAFHNRVERLRDPSHAAALPLSELCRLLGAAGLELSRLDAMTYTLEVDDWIARSSPRPGEGDEARRLLGAAVGTDRCGGKRVFYDDRGRLCFTVRWVFLTATRRSAVTE